jgi:hypothetical protein
LDVIFMPDGEPGTVNILRALSEQLALIRITEMLLCWCFPRTRTIVCRQPHAEVLRTGHSI